MTCSRHPAAVLSVLQPRVACGGDGDFAFEAAVVGIVDDFDVPQAPASWRSTSPRAGSPEPGTEDA